MTAQQEKLFNLDREQTELKKRLTMIRDEQKVIATTLAGECSVV